MALLKRQHIPNIITAMRILLIVPVLYALLTQQFMLAFVVFMVASISDGVDGFLARYFHWTSQWGAFADPLADKTLMLVAYLSLAYLRLLPWWLVGIVIGRDFLIMLGVFVYRFCIEKPFYRASFISKINTTLQFLSVVLILGAEAFHLTQTHSIYQFINLFIYAIVLTTLVSFIDYCFIWIRRAFYIKRTEHGN
jgi:cardiolipin synthase